MSTDTPTDDGAQGTTPAAVLGRVDESVCAFDTDWEFTYVNQQAASLFDREPETLLGETLWEQLPAVADSKAYGALHDALEQQDSQQFDMRYEPHGAWVTVRAYPSVDGLTVCFNEQSESQWRQLERQRSQRLFESVFDETNDALIVADTDRRITDFNPAAERLFGYDAPEVIGEQSEILYADTETFEEQGEQRYNEQATESHDRYVVEYERADGTTFEGETVGTPLEGQDGEPFAFFATVRDVTSRLKYERDVERRNRVLKQFHGITTDESERFEQQVTAVLELTTEYLGLDNGMLAEIDGNEYTVRQAVTDGEPTAPGTTFALEETFCERVIDSDGPVGFPSAAAGEMTAHPAYQSRDVEAYLGAPVYVDGNSYGTVNFSSAEPRANEISESEETFVRIISQWLGKEMSRRQNRERADRERERLRQIVDMLPQLVFVKDESGAFLLANEAVAEAYGTTVAELEDSFDADFAENEKEAEQFRADDRAVIESGEAKYIPEEPLTTADGTERILATRKIPYDPVDTDGDAVLGVSTDITERKEREAELEMQSAAMEAAMDGISILDADGEYIYMNDAHASVFDHAPEELMGSSWRRLYADAEVERLEQDVFPELERTGQWRGETVGRRRDGTPVDQEITLSLLDDGKLICTNRDITARKAWESELEQYEALIENMNESAFIVDNDSQLVYANEQALAYAGATPDAVIGKDVGTLVQEMVTDEAAANAFVDALDATLDGVQVDERYEVPLETPTGEYVLEYMFAPFSSDGRHQAAIVARDVTEQNAREQELERKQSRLRALFDESPDGIIVHDERGAILDANTTQAELLSYDLDELRSLNVAKIEAGLGRSELQGLWQSMDIGETKKVEGNHRRKHGSIYPVEVWISKTQVHGRPRFIAVSRDITERKARESDLVRNREFLEKTQEIAAVGGWEIDLRRDKLQWTDEVYRIHDLPLDAEVTVEDGIDFYHPDDRATLVDAYEQLVEAGEPYDLELRIITAGGETKWVRTVADPQFEDGAVVSVRGIFQDITDRKRLEQSLRENEQSIRDVTTVAADTDRSFQEKLTAILDIGCERLDLPLGFLNKLDSDTQHVVEAVGSHPDIQAGESAPRSKAYCRETVKQDVPLTIQNAVNEGWGEDPAYEAFDLGCYIGGQVVVNGDTYGSLCFADREGRDKQFDELEQAFVELLVQWVSYELASQKVETKLRELNETAQRLLSAGDADEVTSIAIESANKVLGLPLTGIWYYDGSTDTLVPDGVTDEVRDVLDEQPAFTGDGSLAWETFQRDEVGVYNDLQDQDERYNEETPLESEIIVPLGGHGVMISGAETQRAFSETDVGLFEILGATVETALERAEREQVLRDTQGQLKQSNEELEQFAYAASHDLQEPLRTVSSYLTLLERRNREAFDEDAMEFIDFAIDGADRMREMIQALLEYSRVDTHRQSLERTAMQDVFETVTRNLEVSIEESGATVDTPDSATTVEGDPSQLVQLFQNLVGNGIKYCDDDPSVDISVVRSGDGVVEYAVADNGIGMAPDQINGIFEVFQRLHTNAEFDGTGIGLSICRKIVDRHDGDIRVESTPGEGSTFFVTLPVTGQNDE